MPQVYIRITAAEPHQRAIFSSDFSGEFSFASRTLMHETRVGDHAGGTFSGEGVQ
jgi:hypothetical protein